MTSEFRRRESRYRINDPTEVRVVVRTDDAPDPINAELIDLSNNGIQLRAFACLKFEQSIEVHVSARDFQFDLVASVKWLRAADESSWFVGCRIEPELSEQTLIQLASMALLERRGGRRRDVRLEASVCGQLERTFTPAVFRNLSEDGFGMTTCESQEVGQRIHVQLRQRDGEAIDVSARVVWQLKSSNGFFCGCELLNRECFSQLTELADAESLRSSSTAYHEKDASLRTSYWVGLAALVVFVFPSVIVMMSENGTPRQQLVAQTQLFPAEQGDQVHSPDSIVSRAQAAPETTVVDRPRALRKTDDPLVKVLSPERSTPAVTTRVTREQRTRTAAQVKTWLDHVANPMRELVEGPRRSLLATARMVNDPPPTAQAKSIVVDTETPVTSSNARRNGATAPISPERAATPDEFVGEAVSKENERPQPAGKLPTEFRTWVDDTGRYRIVARLVAVGDDTVRLLKENGHFASVPLARLSREDKLYVQPWFPASK